MKDGMSAPQMREGAAPARPLGENGMGESA